MPTQSIAPESAAPLKAAPAASADGGEGKIVGSPPVHMGCLFVVLFAFWMILSGRTETKFVIYGLITAAVTVYLTYPLLLVPNEDGSRRYFVFSVSPLKFVSYFFWLMWQLVLANIDVFLATTDQELVIDPKVVRFRFKADNPMASVVLANSITLTPGTVTMNVTNDGMFEIHALTKGAAEGIYSGDFPLHVAHLFDEPENFALISDEEYAALYPAPARAKKKSDPKAAPATADEPPKTETAKNPAPAASETAKKSPPPERKEQPRQKAAAENGAGKSDKKSAKHSRRSGKKKQHGAANDNGKKGDGTE